MKNTENYLEDRSELKQDKDSYILGKKALTPRTTAGILIEAIAIIVMVLFIILLIIKQEYFGIILFIPFLIVVIFFAIHSCRKILISFSVLNKGYYIIAKGEKFWLTGNYDNYSYNFSAIYSEPKAQKIHRFVLNSGDDFAEEFEKLVGAKVKVYINPDNLDEYFIDAEDALHILRDNTHY